ncbi:MAG: response regulator transcription factor [Saprospiraceae bacterium]|nr:response regulator transcription factor [Saprospiraceae bacterium]
MKDVRVLLVEDDAEYSSLLKDILVNDIDLNVIDVVDNYESAIKVLKLINPDLLITDIDLKGEKTGIDIANVAANNKIPIIFISSNEDRKVYDRALKSGSNTFIVKPFHKLTLESAIRAALPEKYESCLNDRIILKSGTTTNVIYKSEVNWLESERNYTTIICKDKKIVVRNSFTELIKLFGEDFILRVHKSYAIPKDRIKVINFSKSIIDIGITTIPIGRTYKVLLKKIFSLDDFETVEVKESRWASNVPELVKF